MILLATASAVILATATVALRPSQSASSASAFFDPCRKIWSHRTMGAEDDENTVKGLNDVISLGVGGVEIDVYYDEKGDKLYVQSEEYRSAGMPLTLSLQEMFRAVPTGSRIWLDFWNLRQLDENVARQAILRLEDAIHQAGLGEQVIVESTSASLLTELRSSNLHTSLWIQLAEPEASAVGYARHMLGAMRARLLLFTTPASAVSLDHQQYSWFVSMMFAGVPILLFTINDRPQLIAAAKDSHVKAILTDKPSLHKEETCLR